MASVGMQLDVWNFTWKNLWQRLAPECGNPECQRGRRRGWNLLRRPPSIRVQSVPYCREPCFDRALAAAVRRVSSPAVSPAAPHRIPLGLLLLSRGQLSEPQLRVALERQRAAGQGRIGEWLHALGFVNEQQITAALARQWSCPILRAIATVSVDRLPRLPASLLEHFVMLPLAYIPATRTLHIVFGEGLDYTVLYAIEQMLNCRTEPCMATPKAVRQRLLHQRHGREDSEIVFDRIADEYELCRIVRSYAMRTAAREVRLASCGPYLWVRLFRPEPRSAVDLLLPALVSPPMAAVSGESPSGLKFNSRPPIGFMARLGAPLPTGIATR